jgi:hypothetical protein
MLHHPQPAQPASAAMAAGSMRIAVVRSLFQLNQDESP